MTSSDEERRLRDALASEAGEYVTVRRDDLAWALRSEPIPRPGEGTDWRAVAEEMRRHFLWEVAARTQCGMDAARADSHNKMAAAVAAHTKGGTDA